MIYGFKVTIKIRMRPRKISLKRSRLEIPLKINLHIIRFIKTVLKIMRQLSNLKFQIPYKLIQIFGKIRILTN